MDLVGIRRCVCTGRSPVVVDGNRMKRGDFLLVSQFHTAGERLPTSKQRESLTIEELLRAKGYGKCLFKM